MLHDWDFASCALVSLSDKQHWPFEQCTDTILPNLTDIGIIGTVKFFNEGKIITNDDNDNNHNEYDDNGDNDQ